MADTYDCSTPKTAQQLGDYCYYSEYDERGNIIKSQNPGAEYSLAIYDRRGRLAMSQSGKQRVNNEWSFTKYDVFDRPVLLLAELMNRIKRLWMLQLYFMKSVARQFMVILTKVIHLYPMQTVI